MPVLWLDAQRYSTSNCVRPKASLFDIGCLAVCMRQASPAASPSWQERHLPNTDTAIEACMNLLFVACCCVLERLGAGSARGLFEFQIDRCDCLLSSGVQEANDQGQECVFGRDFMGVSVNCNTSLERVNNCFPLKGGAQGRPMWRAIYCSKYGSTMANQQRVLQISGSYRDKEVPFRI